MADAETTTPADTTKTVELVDQVNPTAAGLPGYIGVGLIGGMVVGFAPLRDAVQGNGPFEDAILRLLACLLVCLVAASVLGRLLDNVAVDAAGGTETDTGTGGTADDVGSDPDRDDVDPVAR